MSTFYLSFLGPVFFLSSFLIHILNKDPHFGYFEAALLGMYFLQHLPSLARLFHPLGLGALYSSLFFMLGSIEPVYFFSIMISSQVSLFCLKQHILFLKEREKIDRLNTFMEDRLKASLNHIHKLEDSLDTLLELPLDSFCHEEVISRSDDMHEYDESLDELEKIIQESLKEPKEEKKPLKRLRRIVMKQTNFFEDQSLF
jgi:hypothetical protein